MINIMRNIKHDDHHTWASWSYMVIIKICCSFHFTHGPGAVQHERGGAGWLREGERQTLLERDVDIVVVVVTNSSWTWCLNCLLLVATKLMVKFAFTIMRTFYKQIDCFCGTREINRQGDDEPDDPSDRREWWLGELKAENHYPTPWARSALDK